MMVWTKKSLEKLTNEGFEINTNKIPAEELVSKIPEYDALIVKSATQVTKDVIDAGKKLRIIGRAGVGVDNIDIGAATEKGIVVANSPYGTTNAVSELAVGLMVSVARNIPQAHISLQNKIWKKKQFKGTELYSKNAGIIGCGRMGQRTAEILKYGFKMNILGYDPFVKSHPDIKFTDLEDLLKNSDYVIHHTPKLKDGVIGKIGKKELEMMKNTAYLIDVSRGGNVDEKALNYALKEKIIAGAAKDVYEKEGKEEGQEFKNELFNLKEEFIGTSHLGASSKEGQEKGSAEIADVVISYLKKAKLINSINAAPGEEIEDKEKQVYSLFIVHKNQPGIFGKIDSFLGEENINIEAQPAAVNTKNIASTTYFLSKKPSEKIISEIKSIEGIYRVAD